MFHGFVPHGYMTGYSWGGIAMGIIVVMLVLIAVVALVRNGKKDTSGSSGNRGQEILEERFARGEITPEQFRSMKSELVASGS